MRIAALLVFPLLSLLVRCLCSQSLLYGIALIIVIGSKLHLTADLMKVLFDGDHMTVRKRL